MRVLGIDTATAASAACVLRSDGSAFEVEPAASRLAEPPAHASELMPAVVRCLDESGLDWGELDAIAVGVGPGMFTGLRIGIATARGLAAATEVELRPVSSLAALAAGVDGLGAERDDLRPVLALIDARRGEVFAALHDGPDTVWEPFVAAPEALAERIEAEGISPLAVGDGAVRFQDVLEAAGAAVPEAGSRSHVVRGRSICRLAATAAPASIEAVLPRYIRLPDAKPRTA
ncbi:MAG TPA: tRNA (adenosine(37)-N6)-threonylcarbamoyltransferase complex dimerization subunit type 1 TsaB [Thermoleophilaceae bacterium]|nr:tRNA (adenosine(37)-N6)-threonylcarbamoyltransferase complex dimerization subunit type 1 TsaB [Thermoleophilaceae bacterium]